VSSLKVSHSHDTNCQEYIKWSTNS